MKALCSFCAVSLLLALAACSDKSVSLDEDKALSVDGQNQSQQILSSGVLPLSSDIPQSSASTTITGTYIVASTANQTAMQTLFSAWKNAYYVTYENETNRNSEDQWNPDAVGSARIRYDDTNTTVSEGIGYGMLMAFFMQDQDMFDRLWKYHRAFRPFNGYLMQWTVTTFFMANGNGAADADLDVITALLLAYERNPARTDYLSDALLVAAEFWRLLILSDPASTTIGAGTYLILPGAGFESRGVFNPSYFSPVGLRLLAKHDPNHDWNQALDKNYAYMQNIMDKGCGLFPDWTDAAGVPKNPENGSSNARYFDMYGLEAVRIPWRLTWDHLWYGGIDSRAYNLVNRMADFFVNAPTGPHGVIDAMTRYYYATGVSISGTKIGQKAGMCVTGMIGEPYRAMLEDCTPKITNTVINPPARDYFNPILQTMYSIMLNGLWTKPMP